MSVPDVDGGSPINKKRLLVDIREIYVPHSSKVTKVDLTM